MKVMELLVACENVNGDTIVSIDGNGMRYIGHFYDDHILARGDCEVSAFEVNAEENRIDIAAKVAE